MYGGWDTSITFILVFNVCMKENHEKSDTQTEKISREFRLRFDNKKKCNNCYNQRLLKDVTSNIARIQCISSIDIVIMLYVILVSVHFSLICFRSFIPVFCTLSANKLMILSIKVTMQLDQIMCQARWETFMIRDNFHY